MEESELKRCSWAVAGEITHWLLQPNTQVPPGHFGGREQRSLGTQPGFTAQKDRRVPGRAGGAGRGSGWVGQHPLQNCSLPCEILLKCVSAMCPTVLAGGSGRCWQIQGKKRIFIASGWSAWHWPQQGSSFHYSLRENCRECKISPGNDSKSNLLSAGPLWAAGRESKAEAMFLSFFLQMSNLVEIGQERIRGQRLILQTMNETKATGWVCFWFE